MSAATGIAILVALIRGFTSMTTESIDNFWVDLVRSILYGVALPVRVGDEADREHVEPRPQ